MVPNFIQEANDEVDLVRIQRYFVDEDNELSKSSFDLVKLEETFESIFGSFAPIFLSMSSIAYDIVSSIKELSFYKKIKQWSDATKNCKKNSVGLDIKEKISKQMQALYQSSNENSQTLEEDDFFMGLYDSKLKSLYFYMLPITSYFDHPISTNTESKEFTQSNFIQPI